jgi:hypothetical protein
MSRITEYYPNLTDEALDAMGGGFTVLAHSKEQARKEILLQIDPEDFTEIEIMGSWDLDNWETKDRLERQDFY